MIYAAVLFGILFAGLLIANPFWGLLAVITAVQFEYFIPLGGELSVSRLLGVSLTIGWLIYILRNRGQVLLSQRDRALLYVVLTYLAIVLLGVLISVNFLEGVSRWVRLLMLVMMCWFVQDLITNANRFRVLVWVIGISYGGAALAGILQSLGLMDMGHATGREDTLRYTGTQTNANGYGMILMSGIPYLVLGIRQSKSNLMRILALALIGMALISLFLTASRTHIYALVGFTAFYGLSQLRYRLLGMAEIALLAVLVILFCVAIARTPEHMIKRVLTTRESSSEHRASIVMKGFNLFLQRPIVGVGLGNSKRYGPIRLDSHDMVSTSLGETGLLGTLLFGSLCIMTLVRQTQIIGRLRQSKDPFFLHCAIVTRAAFAALLLTVFANVIVNQRVFWIYIGLTSIMYYWSLSVPRLNSRVAAKHRPNLAYSPQ